MQHDNDPKHTAISTKEEKVEGFRPAKTVTRAQTNWALLSPPDFLLRNPTETTTTTTERGCGKILHKR